MQPYEDYIPQPVNADVKYFSAFSTSMFGITADVQPIGHMYPIPTDIVPLFAYISQSPYQVFYDSSDHPTYVGINTFAPHISSDVIIPLMPARYGYVTTSRYNWGPECTNIQFTTQTRATLFYNELLNAHRNYMMI
jgi:hypothetical protein